MQTGLNKYLIRVGFFLIIIFVITVLLYPVLQNAFLSNIFINSIIYLISQVSFQTYLVLMFTNHLNIF